MARSRLICLLLALTTLLAYLPTGWHSFITYDDPNYITENPIVQAGLTWSGAQWAFCGWHASNWHPLTWLSHMLDCQLFDLDPGAHHLVSAAIHSANVVLLFLFLYRTAKVLWAAAAVAALFAWHPLHAESVAWAAERKDVLSTLFGLLSLLAYVRFGDEAATRKPNNARRYYFAALALFGLSLLSKPMLVTLPFLLLLLDWWPLRRFEPSLTRNPALPAMVLEKAPFLLLALASCVVTYLAQQTRAVVSLEQYPLDLRVGNAMLSYGRYLLKAFWPSDMAVFYPLPPTLNWMHVAFAITVLCLISACVWSLRKAHPYLSVGWLWFLGTLVPVIGFVQVGRAAMADRYTYFPLVGIFIAAVYGLRAVVERFHIKPAGPALGAGLVLAACLFLTERQLGYWRDGESVFTHALAVTQNNSVAHINLGVALEHQGRQAEALAHYQAALSIDASSTEAHNDTANCLAAMGNQNDAYYHYQESLRLDPENLLAHLNLGSLLVGQGKYTDAASHFTKAAAIDPRDPRPLYLTGKVCLLEKRDAEAVSSFRSALRLNGSDIQTMTWLARVLATDEDAAIRNGPEAVAVAQRAASLTDSKIPFILDTLAAACAETGRFADAVDVIQRAIGISTDTGDSEGASAMRERLELYQSHQPYREVFTKTPGH